MMKRNLRLTVAGISLVLLTSLVLAIPGIPHQFYGSVSVDGQPIGDGIIISAKCDGDTYSTTTLDGGYGFAPNIFYVEDPYGGRLGYDIEIYINNIIVNETSFENGELTELNIDVSGFCGDGICSSGESCSICPSDCGTCPSTGDGDSSSGGTSSVSACVEDWECSEWSDVSNACGKRTCTDTNNCGTNILKPEEKRSCTETKEAFKMDQTSQGAGITGGVIGFAKTGAGIGIIIVLIIVLVGILGYFGLKKRPRKQ